MAQFAIITIVNHKWSLIMRVVLISLLVALTIASAMSDCLENADCAEHHCCAHTPSGGRMCLKYHELGHKCIFEYRTTVCAVNLNYPNCSSLICWIPFICFVMINFNWTHGKNLEVGKENFLGDRVGVENGCSHKLQF